METKPSGPNRSSEISLVGDEPSRAVGVDHTPESGKAADTHEPNPRLPRERACVNPEHAKAIYGVAQLCAAFSDTQVPVASTEHAFILVIEMPSVLLFSNSKR